MKEFRCGDLIPGCDAVFEYDSYPQLLGMVVRHAAGGHVAEPLRRYVARLPAPRRD